MTEKVYVPGMGNLASKLMIIGEAPSYAETTARKPFVGPSGRELDNLLKDAKISRSDTWVTNVCKYEVPPNVGKAKVSFRERANRVGINLDQQLEELQVEINEISQTVYWLSVGLLYGRFQEKPKFRKHRGASCGGWVISLCLPIIPRTSTFCCWWRN